MTVDVKALRDLLANGSPRPWIDGGGHTRFSDVHFGAGPSVITAKQAAADEVLLVAAVNALPELLGELERYRAAEAAPFDRRCADALADEVATLVRRGLLDSRSPAADALLDYRDPPSTPRADRMAQLEMEIERLRSWMTRMRALEAVAIAARAVTACEEHESNCCDGWCSQCAIAAVNAKDLDVALAELDKVAP